jgi:hypothetical protein
LLNGCIFLNFHGDSGKRFEIRDPNKNFAQAVKEIKRNTGWAIKSLS